MLVPRTRQIRGNSINLIAATLLFLVVPRPGVLPAQPVTSVDSIGLTVSNLDRSVRFFSEVLSFEKVAEFPLSAATLERLAVSYPSFGDAATSTQFAGRAATMRLGNETIELTEYSSQPGRPVPTDSAANDQWFQHIAIIVRDMDEAYKRLRKYRVRHASAGPQQLPEWNQKAAGIRAFYFRDPDGHFLEVLQFPAGKGDSRWHRPTDRLFLGIDHTAIVTADTDRSLDFYQGRLGLRVAGESENYGPEQERLNGVFAARLRITTLKASHGPGVELLEYISPANGRAFPADTRPNDLISWQIKMKVEPPNHPDRWLKDPDGHTVHLVPSTN